ncbi:MAG: tetratricopeptide repeat protein [Deltaproteobacteria bacterium]|nr:tetratricopeptide repeat protein [Deltaproteobacteria bacterium]MBW2120604.1 tetratricopeptide repeat protein [Deltaproteobacteria bacterium]
MPEQLGLFTEENTLFNTATQQILDMDFSGCLESLVLYQKRFPWGRDVGPIIEIASFLSVRLAKESRGAMGPEEVEGRYQVWQEFETAFGYPWQAGSFQERLQTNYFSVLVNGLVSGGCGGGIELPGGTPVGLIYLLAGRIREAAKSLEALIQEKHRSAAACGYLGDAYLLLGDVDRARLCYREAFTIEPAQVDLKRLQDGELRLFLETISEDEAFERDPVAWLPVAGQLEGFFERRVLRDQADLDRWLARYLELLESQTQSGDMSLIPRLFYHAMVLSDNAHVMRLTGKTDVLEIRRNMKKWQPVVFARHMEKLDSKEKRP